MLHWQIQMQIVILKEESINDRMKLENKLPLLEIFFFKSLSFFLFLCLCVCERESVSMRVLFVKKLHYCYYYKKKDYFKIEKQKLF